MEEKIKVKVEKDLQDIVPSYIQSRKDEIKIFHDLLTKADFEGIRKLGHRMAGSGGGYGFERLTELGRELEIMAPTKDTAGTLAVINKIAAYLNALEIIYE